MPTTNTERMRQIADDLREDGAYTAAASVEAITAQRDALVAALRPFLAIEERASYSYGQVWSSDIRAAQRVIEEIDNASP